MIPDTNGTNSVALSNETPGFVTTCRAIVLEDRFSLVLCKTVQKIFSLPPLFGYNFQNPSFLFGEIGSEEGPRRPLL